MKTKGSINKKNEEKLRAFLAKQTKQDDIKPSNKQVAKPCGKP